ncbi:MAG: binding-protein-dependent transport system inner rane component [Anaerocolumna sp.]|jgi:oligogalacturonide transport system permease protein|nr:binding-protein-dependent transport system inner rane component [Anaerocolumna sp.]
MNTKKSGKAKVYIFMGIFGILMIYPIIWLFFATFKTNAEIFGSAKLLPQNFDWSGYINGWIGNGRITYVSFFKNTFVLVIPVVLFTVISSSIVAYGFARFNFPFKKPLFMVLIATLMLPNAVIIIPRYTLFNQLGWLNSYLPFYMLALFACYPFFIYQLIQFFRGMPRDLDESAYIDGCGTFRVFWNILLPLMKPALFSAGLFQFMWSWNDFMNPLIFINSVNKYPLSLALRMSLDIGVNVAWNQVLAMALISVIPLIVLFFMAQKYFVEGIATTGLKG